MTQILGTFQGIEGCHSRLVLSSFLEKMNIPYTTVGCNTYRKVATLVLTGKADIGILPVDNAIAGTVREGYDLLAQYDLVPISEVDWRMDHRLLALPGAKIEGIREVYAHPLVLEECGKFLGTLSAAKTIPFEDTGAAARFVAESKDPSKAAIAPPESATLYSLECLAENIADHPENYTRFLVFRSPKTQQSTHGLESRCSPDKRKTSCLLSLPHENGALTRCLWTLSEAGINLTKLESRPKLGKAWEYLFYLDFEGDKTEP